jgi:hypothetical protein
MGWFRSRSRSGSYLALFALAFQLAVSFGHVHLDHIAPVSAGREDLADDCCLICTLIHLAGALVPAETPSLPLPSVFGQLQLEAAVEFDLTASHGALFRARAPPIA